MKLVQKIALLALLASGIFITISCHSDRHPSDARRVMLYYVAGYNDLASYLREDIADLAAGTFIPSSKGSSNILLVFSRLASGSSYSNSANPPVLYRLYSEKGKVFTDTLYRWPAGTLASDVNTISDALTRIRELFPAKSYGMVFSSHATGWVPEGYYTSAGRTSASRLSRRMYTPQPKEDPDMPAVKSIGRDLNGSFAPYELSEMEVQSFADAIPYKLEYLMFDCCLMGGIETAYALAGKAQYVGFSQTEVLAEGFQYGTIAYHLIGRSKADVRSVCDDYFSYYDNQSGQYRSATISLIDCDRLAPLASVCKDLFERYRAEIAALEPSDVQRFGRYHNGSYGYSDHNWYFDLKDILDKAGITNNEKAALQAALDDCVLYEGHTPSFLNTFDINVSCGLSMYLPSAGDSTLDDFYKSSFSWNDDTLLIK